MLKLLVNFFGRAAAFAVVVVEAGAVLLLPALLVDGVRATASRFDDDDAALSVSMEGVVADSVGASVALSSCFAVLVSLLEVSVVVASSVEAATEVWTDGRVSLPLPEREVAAS